MPARVKSTLITPWIPTTVHRFDGKPSTVCAPLLGGIAYLLSSCQVCLVSLLRISDDFGTQNLATATDRMETKEASTVSPPQPPKYSRYRSVRNTATAGVSTSSSSKHSHSTSTVGIKRSVSRYKKPCAVNAPLQSDSVPALRDGSLPQGSLDSHRNQRQEAEIKRLVSSSQALKIEGGPDIQCDTQECATKPRLGNKAQQEAYEILNGAARHTKSSTSRQNGEVNGGRRHQKRPELSKVRTNPSYTTSESVSDDTLGVGSRSQAKKEPAPSSTASPEARPMAHGFDAPKSAVNAGTRQVTVKYNETSVLLPVTPTSTPDDILFSASNVLGKKIDPSSHILLESFKQVGLERPLRRYEHVRDVMNSWDQDDQNTLLIIPSSAEGKDDHLEIQSVAREQPGEMSVGIYHSQRPGTWDKRWATLRPDGQVLVAKQSGTEGKNICHISDFDIYMPTSRQLKELKPPRKYCFAIKSQQKSAMFLNTVNFVHFFATKDKVVAAAWYKAVQGWRSWYLVHEMGLGQGTQSAKNHSSNSNQNQHQRTASTVSTSHRGRPLKPPPPEQSSSSGPTPITPPTFIESVGGNSASRSFNNRGGPPVSYPKKLTKDPVSGAATTRNNRGQSLAQIQYSGPNVTESPFSTNGLLGRTYSQRALQAKLDDQRDNSQSQTINPKIKPLVELTPRDPKASPQYLKKAHGSTAERFATGGGLIEAVANAELDDQQAATTQRKAVHEQDQLAESAFTGRGLLAGAGEGQGGRRQGKGVACGDRAATEPLLELERKRAFAQGSLLDSVERMRGDDERGPLIERGKAREVMTRTGEGGY